LARWENSKDMIYLTKLKLLVILTILVLNK
jgi:hypothetical protein